MLKKIMREYNSYLYSLSTL